MAETNNVTPEPDGLLHSAVSKKFPGYTSENLSEKGVHGADPPSPRSNTRSNT